MTPPKRKVVLDANVVLRRLLDESLPADEVLRRDELVAPAVIVLETLNGLVNARRFRGLRLDQAAALLEQFLKLPIELVSDRDLVGATLGVGSELGLSAYDGVYVALAASRDVPLVTADRRLAASYPRSELIP